jgi:MFS family permease
MTTAVMTDKNSTKWVVLTLAGITNALVAAAPGMSMSVLFAEIAADLDLSLVQVGVVWGIGSLPAILSALLGGGIIDRFGPKRVLQVTAVLASLAGALRGLSNNFAFLVFSVILMGLIGPLITMSGLKLSRLWFPDHQLGASGGILSMGMALGFFLSSTLSATVLSPWLGGWRNVFFFYGGVSILLVLPWFLMPAAPASTAEDAKREIKRPSLVKSFVHIASKPNSWFLGLALFGLGGAIQSFLGYLPLYLRSVGWQAATADNALAGFHLISMLFTLPLALLSDRVRRRKPIVLLMMAITTIGMGAVGFVNGGWVWAAVLFAGAVRDGFMAVFLAMVINADGVDPGYAATATGFTFLFINLGNILMPAAGNAIAENNPSLAFAFWAACGAAGMLSMLLVKEKPRVLSS